jgi:hypothetical protein
MLTQVRTGWKYFHAGRKYADLNGPTYTIDDALCKPILYYLFPGVFQMLTTYTLRFSFDVYVFGQRIFTITKLDDHWINGSDMPRCAA